MNLPQIVSCPQPKKGTIAQVAIQCVSPDTGETGTFLFIGESHRNINSTVSPVMGGVVELYEWAKRHKWVINRDHYIKES